MAKVGVVFSNLGTPKAATSKEVGRYLAEFLMDPYVIQIPYFFRFLLVKGIISNFRAKKSAENYKKIWTPQGSPLLVETQKAAQALQKKLGENYKVVVAMRYGEPSFEQARLELKGCEKIIFFPQYPQYADSTFRTSVDYFKKFFGDKDYKIVKPYYENSHFINSYAAFLKKQLDGKDMEHLLMSFHGLPESHLHKADPSQSHCLKKKNCCERAEGEVLNQCYRAQCARSADALAKAMGLTKSQYSISFQSRLGRQKWIEPYTEEMYQKLIQKGVKNIAVICPGFSVDGLETLEEIALGGKEAFLNGGGESFYFVPCLNDDPGWIDACVQILKET